MTTQKIFDAHAHLAPGAAALERILISMDKCGIDRAIVVAGGVVSPDVLARQLIEGGHVKSDADNESLLISAQTSGGRLVPFFFANPHCRADVYRGAGADFRGLKLAPSVHGLPFDDVRVIELIQIADDLGHNVYAHCLNRPGFGVRDYVLLARRFPQVTFALGHAGVGDLDLYGIDLIVEQNNIVFETSCGLTATVQAACSRLGSERLLFGTEYPMQSPRVELTKLDELDLSMADRQIVVWENVCRFAGVPA